MQSAAIYYGSSVTSEKKIRKIKYKQNTKIKNKDRTPIRKKNVYPK
jgi:hypothetical protein